MSLDENIIKNKAIQTPPATKGFHFAATAEYLAEFVEAETISAAEMIYRKVRRPIKPDVGGTAGPAGNTQSTTTAAQSEEKEVQ